MFAPALADTVSGIDPAAFAELSELEAGYFWFVARSELIVGLADKYFPLARQFLEIGCGTGTVLRDLAASRPWERLVGSELHPAGLVHARQRLPTGVEFVQLRGLRAATRDGGGTIIAVPQHPWLWSRADDLAHHQRRYRRGELEEKLRRNGFEILFSSSFTAVLLPLMAASRLKGGGKQLEQDPFREFRINPRLNALLTAILRAEVRLTRAGWRWPVGGSRVVVARAV
jgi:SAM-dependent methyltransferase